MEKELQKLKEFGENLIQKYEQMPLENTGQMFGKQIGMLDRMQKFSVGGGQELVDYANIIMDNYKGDDREELKNEMTAMLKTLIKSGTKRVFDSV